MKTKKVIQENQNKNKVMVYQSDFVNGADISDEHITDFDYLLHIHHEKVIAF